MYSVFEICAGGGGQAIGLERAGFEQAGAVELDAHACASLRRNRPDWNVVERDVRDVNGRDYRGATLFAAGVPCPPFSVAGKQLGRDDERDLFPQAVRLIAQAEPDAILLENVPGFASERFRDYRAKLLGKLRRLGYESDFRILNACDFGVAQLRPRFVLVGLRPRAFGRFEWPGVTAKKVTVGRALGVSMAAGGWPGAAAWAQRANAVGPTLVGGSKLHGGPDLGPTRARQQWLALGVDGRGLADAPPGESHPVEHIPRLTVPMTAVLQGFPKAWKFAGGKTAAYRQVGNAFPPPVAEAVGTAIIAALAGTALPLEYAGTGAVQGRFFERANGAD